jgi:hypothetical protein
VLYDPVLNVTFPFNLTNPETIPTRDNDPVVYPVPLAVLTNSSAEGVVAAAMVEVMSILTSNNSALTSNCSKCVTALSIGQMVARLAPTLLPDAMIALCQSTGFSSNSTCQTTYEAGSFGATWTQILAKADVTGLDGRLICASLSSSFCPSPNATSVKATFPKSKPANLKAPQRSGKTVKVLHLSDLHLGKLQNSLI